MSACRATEQDIRMTDHTPRPEPLFRHADDFEWQEVRVQDHGGRRVAVREKWVEFSPRGMSLLGQWDPGMIVRRHGHLSRQIIYVLAGSMTVGEVLCTPGMHITLDEGAAAGPMIAGPAGVEVFEVMWGDPRSWSEDQAAYEALLAERGITELAHPPLQFPDFMAGAAAAHAARASITDNYKP
jgi:quercetin dioxygenase-like cupin family protein